MAHLNIEKISLASRDREKEEQKKNLRKKVLFALINHYFEENGLVQSAEVLKSESKLAANDYVVCDNIHLDSILQDFESYHFLRYQKLPQIVKKLPENKREYANCDKQKSSRIKSASKYIVSARKYNSENDERLFKEYSVNNNDQDISKSYNCYIGSDTNHSQYKSIELYEKHTPEWHYLASLVMQDFCSGGKNIQWSDIIGHERAKQFLKEAVVYPIKYRELFSSAVVPWKSILLYGPTGTGKTSLAAAIASESKAAFFYVCVSTLTSKWRGESEKLVKVLFDLAKYHAPAVIFIDEIDSLMNHRGSDHEASRRMKTEFFCQMDSISSCNNVFVLAATNMPWELDCAVLRRMEKRILIPLPNPENRVLLFKKFLPSSIEILETVVIKTELNYEDLSTASEKFSASDIELLCKEVKMSLIRQILHNIENNNKLPRSFNIETLKTSDVLLILSSSRPSCASLPEKYNDWKNSHGSE